ncbi:MAG: hypothetical protein HOF11_14485, partial [Rhodospirillaceae bacterium]|nr:hypothetical protein [Rhodospirillaceae bacterium]
AKDQKTREAMQCKLAAYINKTGNMAFGGGNRYHVITQPNIKGIRGFSYGTPYVWYMWRDNG